MDLKSNTREGASNDNVLRDLISECRVSRRDTETKSQLPMLGSLLDGF